MKKWEAACLDGQWYVVCDDGHPTSIAQTRDRETAVLICQLHRVFVALRGRQIISIEIDPQPEK